MLVKGAPVTPYVDRDLGHHWLRQLLVAWRHQAITWTKGDLSSVRSNDLRLRASSQEIPQPSITEIIWKIKDLICHSNFPGAIELMTTSIYFHPHNTDGDLDINYAFSTSPVRICSTNQFYLEIRWYYCIHFSHNCQWSNLVKYG